jgi:hypothetical protein
MGADGVERNLELAGDLRPGEVRRQIAEHRISLSGIPLVVGAEDVEQETAVDFLQGKLESRPPVEVVLGQEIDVVVLRGPGLRLTRRALVGRSQAVGHRERGRLGHHRRDLGVLLVVAGLQRRDLLAEVRILGIRDVEGRELLEERDALQL